MTNDEIMNVWNEMVKIYGDKLPNPEQQPIQFAYFLKLYNFYHKKGDTDGNG